MLNLDTHILLHALTGALRADERRLLERHPWSISAIVLWEIAKLAQLGRIDRNLDDAELAKAVSMIHIWPITLAVCRAIRELDFKGDPAAELIAATSLVHDIPLITRDTAIHRSRLLKFA